MTPIRERALAAFLKAYGSQDSFTKGLDDAAELARTALSTPIEEQSESVACRDKIFRAAERTNKRYGQWMPQQWLEIFIGEMTVDDD